MYGVMYGAMCGAMYGSRETKSGITQQKKNDTTLNFLLNVFHNDTNQVASKSQFEKFVINFVSLYSWRGSYDAMLQKINSRVKQEDLVVLLLVSFCCSKLV